MKAASLFALRTMKRRLVKDRPCGTEGEKKYVYMNSLALNTSAESGAGRIKNRLKEIECEDVDRIQLAQNRDQE